MTVAMYLVGATLSVATPNTSYIHTASTHSTRATTTASSERSAPARPVLSMNGRGQYWHAGSTDECPATTGSARTFLSGGK
jgi:hypothetical protein